MRVWYFPSMSRHCLKMNLAGLCRPAVVVDRFYISVFSALEQTHCALVACDSNWVTVAFYSAFWISTEVVYLSTVQLLHGWCHLKLLPLWHVLCTPYNHAPCHLMQSHIHRVHVCLVVTSYVCMLCVFCGHVLDSVCFQRGTNRRWDLWDAGRITDIFVALTPQQLYTPYSVEHLKDVVLKCASIYYWFSRSTVLTPPVTVFGPHHADTTVTSTGHCRADITSNQHLAQLCWHHW